jgi:type IV pilus assembly protein PilO
MNGLNLRNLRQRDWAIIIVVLTALLGVAWFFLMYRPSQERIARLESEITQLDLQIQRGLAAQRNLPDLRAAVAQLELAREEFLAELPRESQIASLLDQLREAAELSEATFASLSSTGARTENIQGVRPLGFTMNMVGDYASTLAFLRSLEELRRFTKIHQVNLSLADDASDNPPLNSSFSFTVYVFTGSDPGARP